jgi:hypothetical protein
MHVSLIKKKREGDVGLEVCALERRRAGVHERNPEIFGHRAGFHQWDLFATLRGVFSSDSFHIAVSNAGL